MYQGIQITRYMDGDFIRQVTPKTFLLNGKIIAGALLVRHIVLFMLVVYSFIFFPEHIKSLSHDAIFHACSYNSS